MRVVWSPRAIERAVEAAHFIARDKPGAARKWLEGLFAVTARLVDFPESGRQVPELGHPAFREVAYGKYRVIYRLERRRVAVLSVRHAARRFDPGETGKRD